MNNNGKEQEFVEIRRLREMGYNDEEIRELVQLSIAIEQRRRSQEDER